MTFTWYYLEPYPKPTPLPNSRKPYTAENSAMVVLKNRRYHTDIYRWFHEAPTTRWRYAYTIAPIKRYAYAATEIHTHTAISPDGYN